MPGWLSIFKDYVVSIAATMSIIFYISALAAGQEQVEELAGGIALAYLSIYESVIIYRWNVCNYNEG